MLIKHAYLPEEPFWGIGDFIRGCLSLRNLCEEFGFTLELDYTYHPISEYLTNSIYTSMEYTKEDVTIYGIDDFEHLYSIFNQLKQFSNEDLKTMVLYIGTNAWYLGKGVSDETREFMKTSLQPTPELLGAIWKTQSELGILPKEYSVLHIRMGDDYLVKGQTSEEAFAAIHGQIMSQINHDITKPIVVLSDCYNLKQYLHEKEGWLYSPIQPCHLSTNVKGSRVKDTLVDFFLITEASSLYCISNHGYGSGFCDWACDIYKVPCIRLKNPEVVKT